MPTSVWYVALCLVAPAVWGVLLVRALDWWEARRRRRTPGGEPPPVDYSI